MDSLAQALNRSSLILELSLDGRILRANDLFLACTGFRSEELEGLAFQALLSHGFIQSEDYVEFWSSLRVGGSFSGEFLVLGKDRQERWLQAIFNAVQAAAGDSGDAAALTAIVMVASDITQARQVAASRASIDAALRQSMAVIEFDVNGCVLDANQVFLRTLEYSLDEIKGQPHRIFVSDDYAGSSEYSDFWQRLKSAEFSRGRFQRISKSGRAIWLEACYSPVLNGSGKLVKIVKFAYDVTSAVVQSDALVSALAEAKEAERVRLELDRAIHEMSTPVTPVWEGILLLPLVGILDSIRASEIMARSLGMISESGAKILLLDISGVPNVDTSVANEIIKITKATRLMGCETIVSGLSPAIAQSIVGLGIDVGGIRTTAALRDSFLTALKAIGQNIKVKRKSKR